LAEKIKCRTLFSTHYHLLTEELYKNPLISMYQMGIHIDEENKTIIFTYKFQKGICEKSYGLSVARTAGIPDEVCKEAEISANKLLSETEDNFDFGELTKNQKNIFLALYDCLNENQLTKEEILKLQNKLLKEYCVFTEINNDFDNIDE
jgi:DNA mismatch repair ATPase MutS